MALKPAILDLQDIVRLHDVGNKEILEPYWDDDVGGGEGSNEEEMDDEEGDAEEESMGD
jgi:hypothetical protein